MGDIYFANQKFYNESEVAENPIEEVPMRLLKKWAWLIVLVISVSVAWYLDHRSTVGGLLEYAPNSGVCTKVGLRSKALVLVIDGREWIASKDTEIIPDVQLMLPIAILLSEEKDNMIPLENPLRVRVTQAGEIIASDGTRKRGFNIAVE